MCLWMILYMYLGTSIYRYIYLYPYLCAYITQELRPNLVNPLYPLYPPKGKIIQ